MNEHQNLGKMTERVKESLESLVKDLAACSVDAATTALTEQTVNLAKEASTLAEKTQKELVVLSGKVDNLAAEFRKLSTTVETSATKSLDHLKIQRLQLALANVALVSNFTYYVQGKDNFNSQQREGKELLTEILFSFMTKQGRFLNNMCLPETMARWRTQEYQVGREDAAFTKLVAGHIHALTGVQPKLETQDGKIAIFCG